METSDLEVAGSDEGVVQEFADETVAGEGVTVVVVAAKERSKGSGGRWGWRTRASRSGGRRYLVGASHRMSSIISLGCHCRTERA